MMRIPLAVLTACLGTAAIAAADNLPTPASGTCKIAFCQIALDQHVMPQGAVQSAAADGWVVHGAIDGISYRYGSGGPLLYVANRSDQDWQDVQGDNAWLVSCNVKYMMDAPSCWIARTSLSGQVSAGFEISDGKLCLPNYPAIDRAEIAVDGAAAIALPAPDFCVKDAPVAALLQTIQAGQMVRLKGFFSGDDTPAVDMQLQTAGLQQALTLRDWILDQYAAGKLKLAR